MTEHEFDTRLKQIEEGYAARRVGAEAYRDQEVARLFNDSRWTQDHIALKMGQAQSWVCQRLRFGRFLAFITSGDKCERPPDSLTERRFREAWTRAGKRPKEDEDDRFGRVWELLNVESPPLPAGYRNLVKKPGIKKAIVEAITGARRLEHAEIVEKVRESVPDVKPESVSNALRQIQNKPPKGMTLDARHVGRSHRYRLVHPRHTPAAPEGESPISDALRLVRESIREMKKPELYRPVSLVLENLWKIEQALQGLITSVEVA